ncbi:hypothetical protein E2C01_071298 [Portunus trituberculatus]|uniref:Uncharacterized protein n=1 Tax=Portunus trituberculatus TaxID=210409 RepID=A0A5B7I7V1_PORTR|nr:hypothetical protein [Portunus trituberculatus]
MKDGGIHQRGRMSAVTRFKQSVSHGKERKAHQPSPASSWATPRSVLTCTAYVCLVTPSALGVGLPLMPWNISCFNAHPSTLNILQYAPSFPPWPSQHSTCPPSWWLQASTPHGNLLSFALLVPS